VFVLGAGASASHRSANTPLGKDLVWDYHRDCAHLLRDIGGKPDQTQENVDFSKFSKFILLAASLYAELAWLPGEWQNRGWKVLDMHGRLLKKHFVDEMLDLLRKEDNEEGARLVKHLIFEHIAEASFNAPNTLYKRFAKEIVKPKPPGSISIISLNFDCMLHEDLDTDLYYDYLIDFDWIDHSRAESYRHSNPIALIKLNGSLEWGMCEGCGRLHLYYPFMHRTFYEGKVCANRKCAGIVTPFIRVPHDRHGPNMNALRDVAKDHLRAADRVTVVGYSFPGYDKHIIELFQDSLDTNARIEVVDKCRNDQKEKQTDYLNKKYTELFKRSPEIETLDGFGDYLDNQAKQAYTQLTGTERDKR